MEQNKPTPQEPNDQKPADQKPETNIHAGHRERSKARFLKFGADQLEDHQLLELILFYSRKQEDVNPLAHRLIDRFGSLKGVLDASPEELKEIPGISDHTASLLKLFPAVMARYEQSSIERGTIINSVDDVAELLRPCFIGAQTELLYLLCVDAKGKLLSCELISHGSATAVLMDQRRIVQIAIRRRASRIYLGHCHVNGLAIPSTEDIWATQKLGQTLAPMHIRLEDHLVFADDDYISMAQSGLLSQEG